VILFRKKQEEHANVVSALGIPNDFYAGDEEEDEGEEKPKGRFSRAQAEA